MKSTPDSMIVVRVIGMWILCWLAPPLLCHYVGPALGALSALAAAGLWYSQYRFPARKQRSGPYFWFVASGYGFIGLSLLICLGRLIGVRLM